MMTLLETYRRHGPFSAREAAAIGADICATLERLHGADTPLIHRDIKAENVVRRPDGRCVLIDFGIARLYDKNGERDTRVMGTGFASAPEQFGYAQTDPRSDIYSLGVLLHEIATGEYSLSKGKLLGRLGRVTAKCTRFDPADRYQSAGELKKALSRVGRRSGPAVAAAVLIVLAAACALAIFHPQMGKGTAPPYSFASPAIGREVGRLLGKDVEEITWTDLQEITALRLVGEESFDDWEQLMSFGETVVIRGREALEPGHGSVDTLADIPNFPNLTELALCDQEITDLSPLRGCPIERLAIHGNGVSDLSPLADCPGLKELIVSANPVSDLMPLKGLEALWRIDIGATGVEDLSPLSEVPALFCLEALDCPRLVSLEGLRELKGLSNLILRPVGVDDMELLGSLTWLKDLSIWSPECPEDLTALSGLTGLERLFLDIRGLGSLKGIESMTKLTYLDFRGDGERPLNAAPVAGLPLLEELVVYDMYSDTGWSEVSGLANLRNITVRPEDAETVRAALGGREVELIAAAPP